MEDFSGNSFNLITNISYYLQNILSFKKDENYFSENKDEYNELINCFKCLILDDMACSLLSPILTLSYMKQHNVCLNFNINENRTPLNGILAIYLIQSTQLNMKYVVKDMLNNLYQNYYIVFIDVPKNEDLKDFLSQLISNDLTKKVYQIKVIPMTINIFHSNVFDLNLNSSYFRLSSAVITTKEDTDYVNRISEGIFSCLFLLKILPQIIYRNETLFETIVKKIQLKFNDTFNKFPELKNDFKPNSALIICERDTDLPIMFHHSASQGAMLSDLIGISRFPSEKEFQIDPINDYIWNNYICEPYYKVAEQTLIDLKKYSEEMKQFDFNNNSKDIDTLTKETERLTLSIDCLKNNKIKGDILSQQTKYLKLMGDIADKKNLGQLFELEDIILRKRLVSSNEIDQKYNEMMLLVNETNKEDVIRMNLIKLLMAKTKNELDNVYGNINSICKNDQEKQLSNVAQYLLLKKMEEIKMNDVSKTSNYLIDGLKYAMNTFNSLMFIEQPSLISHISNTICTGKVVKDYSTFNLFTEKKENVIWSFNEAMVFVIGGGSFIEYEYIKEQLWRNHIKLIYGTDKLYRPCEFIKDLSELFKLVSKKE